MGENRRRKALYVGKSVHNPPSNCLGCGKEIDGATGVGHRSKPRAGCISICFYCGHLAAYDWQLKLRPLTDAEMIEIAGNEQILAIQKLRGLAMAARAAKAAAGQ
jgi:hypothetical protein